jgi:hypothetical protein
MILVPRHQHGVQRPVEIVAGTYTGGQHRLDGVLDRGRPNPHAGLAQGAGEIDDVVGDAPVGGGLFRFGACHRPYSAAESSAFTSLRMRRVRRKNRE